MRSLAKWVMSIDQRFYDIVAILLMGLAANVIVSGGGEQNEYELLFLASLCALSGGFLIFIRSWRVSIVKRADYNHTLNKQAAATRSELLAKGDPVPDEISSRAEAANNSRSVDIRSEVNLFIKKRGNIARVIVAFIASVFLAGFGGKGIMDHLYFSKNDDIKTFMKSTTITSEERVIDDIRLLRDDIASLSTLLSNKSALTNESITTGQTKTSKALNALQSEISNLSVSLEDLEAEIVTSPPLNDGTENE